jgi:hypothetical protein
MSGTVELSTPTNTPRDSIDRLSMLSTDQGMAVDSLFVATKRYTLPTLSPLSTLSTLSTLLKHDHRQKRQGRNEAMGSVTVSRRPERGTLAGRVRHYLWTRRNRYWNSEERRLIRRGWPAALVKSCFDPFDYAMGLWDGTIILYHSACIGGNLQWVHLEDPEVWTADGRKAAAGTFTFCGDPITFERGMDVQLSAIAWVCDAPWGS